MPDLNLGALTIPVFVTIWGAGWVSCYAILVRPMQDRLSALEGKLTAIEAKKDDRIETLEKRLGIHPGSV